MHQAQLRGVSFTHHLPCPNPSHAHIHNYCLLTTHQVRVFRLAHRCTCTTPSHQLRWKSAHSTTLSEGKMHSYNPDPEPHMCRQVAVSMPLCPCSSITSERILLAYLPSTWAVWTLCALELEVMRPRAQVSCSASKESVV